MELGRLFGFLHPALVHFPLVLLLVSFVLEIVGFIRRDEKFAWAAKLTLVLGAVAALFAFVCGNFAEIWAARDGVAQEPMEQHELYATITSWLFVFLTAGRLFLGPGRGRRWMGAYLVIMAVGCILLVITGHKGAMLVYQHAAGVQTYSTPPLPTHEDLAILGQKQDPEALFYSNNMHHIFGAMVFIFSLLLLVEMLAPKLGARLRRITPILLVAGGIFLLIFSDTDSWPLSPQRPITDKEVLMHKTYAVLMLAFGVQGFRWWRNGRPFPEKSAAGQERQGRIMAVFALIGGALLFTHVHSNAPYANVAVGVYIHHTVMGCIALGIGAVRLLQDALAATSSRRAVRVLAWAYPCLMLTESIFLLNYNEGLPWFLGYRNLSLTAPHHGLIAPLGPARAELTYDPDSSRLDVYLLRQADNTPLPVAAESIEAVARVGTDATLVPLTVCAEKAGTYHFSGTATFLRGAPMFQLKVLVKDAALTASEPGASKPGHRFAVPVLADAGNGSAGTRIITAEFEPWIDARLVGVAHTQSAYVCPMHPSVGAGTPGSCGVCGMALVPNKAARAPDKLHDDGYRMDLALLVRAQRPALDRAAKLHASRRIGAPRRSAPAAYSSNPRQDYALDIHTNPGRQSSPATFATVDQPMAGQPARLVLTPRNADGRIVEHLAVVHTKKLHLIIVSRDLSFFDHVHPEQQPDGSLILDYAFPTAGDYVLYADCTPVEDRNQVFALPVTVSGTPPEPRSLDETPAPAKTFGNYRVRLEMSPNPVQPGDESQVTFTIFENGAPVTDLEPYLGAGGHCVALSADTRSYLHSHPLVVQGSRYGPTVTFHTVFPRSGLYKIWGQFQHRGRPLIADFVIRVP